MKLEGPCSDIWWSFLCALQRSPEVGQNNHFEICDFQSFFVWYQLVVGTKYILQNLYMLTTIRTSWQTQHNIPYYFERFIQFFGQCVIFLIQRFRWSRFFQHIFLTEFPELLLRYFDNYYHHNIKDHTNLLNKNAKIIIKLVKLALIGPDKFNFITLIKYSNSISHLNICHPQLTS